MASVLAAAGAIALLPAAASAALPVGNLLKNGGAERAHELVCPDTSDMLRGGRTEFFGWGSACALATPPHALPYLESGVTGPVLDGRRIGGRAAFRLAGGPAPQELRQDVDLLPHGAAIDAGQVQVTLAGYLGAVGPGDTAQLELYTGSVALLRLDPLSVPDAADDDQELFAYRSVTATLPAGVRGVTVRVSHAAAPSGGGVGYADNVAVALSPAGSAPPDLRDPRFSRPGNFPFLVSSAVDLVRAKGIRFTVGCSAAAAAPCDARLVARLYYPDRDKPGKFRVRPLASGRVTLAVGKKRKLSKQFSSATSAIVAGLTAKERGKTVVRFTATTTDEYGEWSSLTRSTLNPVDA